MRAGAMPPTVGRKPKQIARKIRQTIGLNKHPNSALIVQPYIVRVNCSRVDRAGILDFASFCFDARFGFGLRIANLHHVYPIVNERVFLITVFSTFVVSVFDISF